MKMASMKGGFMKKFVFLSALFAFFIACSSDEGVKKSLKDDTNESVQIEAGDEKSEVNDINVPLPVEESRDFKGAKNGNLAATTNDSSALKTATNDLNARNLNANSQTATTNISTENLNAAKALYESKCAICHGKEGEKKALGNSLIIKDMNRADFIASLKGYQAGTYGRSLARQMKPAANMLDFAQIDALAALIAKAN